MPRTHKSSSRGKAQHQVRLQRAAESRKARMKRAIEDARRKADTLDTRLDKYANYPGNR